MSRNEAENPDDDTPIVYIYRGGRSRRQQLPISVFYGGSNTDVLGNPVPLSAEQLVERLSNDENHNVDNDGYFLRSVDSDGGTDQYDSYNVADPSDEVVDMDINMDMNVDMDMDSGDPNDTIHVPNPDTEERPLRLRNGIHMQSRIVDAVVEPDVDTDDDEGTMDIEVEAAGSPALPEQTLALEDNDTSPVDNLSEVALVPYEKKAVCGVNNDSLRPSYDSTSITSTQWTTDGINKGSIQCTDMLRKRLRSDALQKNLELSESGLYPLDIGDIRSIGPTLLAGDREVSTLKLELLELRMPYGDWIALCEKRLSNLLQKRGMVEEREVTSTSLTSAEHTGDFSAIPEVSSGSLQTYCHRPTAILRPKERFENMCSFGLVQQQLQRNSYTWGEEMRDYEKLPGTGGIGSAPGRKGKPEVGQLEASNATGGSADGYVTGPNPENEIYYLIKRQERPEGAAGGTGLTTMVPRLLSASGVPS
ncbi:hypothetical protein FOZ61_009134 [Perkinsus olseni]|uniref:Uncharacterized protein n=1 Tax=Perkinsus olseni TaxID=32597 RepID=A0A7J6L244_PEROL|nr:hypothetical protein FOZ61_009134 [Perkinsus olseni]KAF4659183.1 hypothetical protein FOL46_006695 [Perkinsus olseni]